MCLRGLWAQNIGSVLPAAVPVLSACPSSLADGPRCAARLLMALVSEEYFYFFKSSHVVWG